MLQLSGLDISEIKSNADTSLFDLTLELREQGKKLFARFEYASDLFDETMIEKMANNLDVLLNGIIAEPEQVIGKLPLLTKEETQMLLLDWNSTQSAYPSHKNVHQLFEDQVGKHADEVAIIFENQQVTYKELNLKSNQLAHYIRKNYQIKTQHPLKSDTLIILCVERGIEMAIGILGILKAGGAYVPVDSSYPDERIKFIVEDTKCQLILTQNKFVQQLSGIATEQELIILDQASYSTEVCTNLSSFSKPEDLAYAIYTSGTTGKPKGIILPHQTLTNLIAWQPEKIASEKVLQFAGFPFDVCAQEIFYALLNGKNLCIFPDKDKHSLEKLVQYVVNEKITTLFLPTAMLSLWAEECRRSVPIFSVLKQIIVAGEALLITESIRLFFTRNPNVKLINQYGPSETHVVSYFELCGDSLLWSSKPAIGKAIANTRLYVLNEQLQPVTIGAPGELYISGVSLAREYIGSKELTEKCFIKNPFVTEQNDIKGCYSRLYKTGDWVRYLSDGNVEYLGRIDQQVKIRGFRIECGEIEATIRNNAQVEDVVVLAREDEQSNKRIVAYVVSSDLNNLEQEELIKALRSELKAKLPDYMVPSGFLILEQLPLNINGKLDHKSLLMPNLLYREDGQYRAPETGVEKQLIGLVADVLNIQSDLISMESNFFSIGGHSLDSMRLVSSGQRIGLYFSVQDVFQSKTFFDLVAVINTQLTISNEEAFSLAGLLMPILPIQKTGHKPPLFLIHSAGGLAMAYKELKNLLEDQPIYAIQNPFFGKEDYFESLSAMVDCYIALIQEVSPKGPYHIGGWSIGGCVALEIAAKLALEGECVERLVLIDSAKVNYDIAIEVDDSGFMERRETRLSKIRMLLGEEFGDDSFVEKTAPKLVQVLMKEIDRSVKLLEGETPPRYMGRTILIKAKEKITGLKKFDSLIDFNENDPFSGWADFLPELEVYSTEGEHSRLFSHSYIDSLRTQLKLALSSTSFNQVYSEKLSLTERNLSAALARKDAFMIDLFLQHDPMLEKASKLVAV